MAVQQKSHYSLDIMGDYVRLRTKGTLDVKTLDEPVNAALTVAKENNIRLLLDDIRGIDTTAVSIAILTKAMGIVWKLRQFERVAIVFEGSRVRSLLFSTLEALDLDHESKIRGFDEEADAIAWLRS